MKSFMPKHSPQPVSLFWERKQCMVKPEPTETTTVDNTFHVIQMAFTHTSSPFDSPFLPVLTTRA